MTIIFQVIDALIRDRKLYLEGGEEEIDNDLGDAQTEGCFRRLVHQINKDHLMDAQQRDQGESRLSQPDGGRRGKEYKCTHH